MAVFGARADCDTLPAVTDPVHLTSPDNPRVKAARRLRQQRHRQQTGLFIAEGTREVTRALTAGLTCCELYWCPEVLGANRGGVLERIDRQPTAQRFTVTPELLSKLAYRENPEGVVGVFEQPAWTLADAGRLGQGRDETGLWLIAAGTQKPGNLGAMARSAEAAGANGLCVCEGVVDAFNPNAIRASTGAVFTLPIVAATTQQTLAFIRQHAVRVVAALPDAPTAYTDTALTGPLAIVIGAEDRGLDSFWSSPSEQAGRASPLNTAVTNPIERVSIPMLSGAVDSLNASVAAAVLLFEAVRQRRVTGLSV